MMILVAIFLGLAIGAIINWAEVYLYQFAVVDSRREPLTASSLTPALWSLLVAAPFRRRLYLRDKDAWLRLFVEVFLGFLFACLWYRLSFTFPFFFLSSLCTFLVLISVIDLKYRKVLNALVLPAIAAMILYQAFPLGRVTLMALLGGAAAFLLFLAVSLVAPGKLGGGDIKLAAFLGVTFGFPYVFWVLVVGALVGGVTAVCLLLTRRWNLESHFPYAPFLCLGAIVAMFYDPTPWLFSL